MRLYADSSYLLQLLAPDFASAAAIALHRSLQRPACLYTAAHELEVPNALRLRRFMASKLAAAARRQENLVTKQALQRLAGHLAAGFRRTPFAWEAVLTRGQTLSERHTEKLGSRALDLLHVAAALELHADLFVTCDRAQAALAKATGLKTKLVS
jgi:predicted nucleic acid-binding protein